MSDIKKLEEAHRLTCRCAGRLVQAVVLKRATRRDLAEIANDLLKSSNTVRGLIAEERRGGQ